ncbi:unnamed protein product [Phaeothamnion confervicola]
MATNPWTGARTQCAAALPAAINPHHPYMPINLGYPGLQRLRETPPLYAVQDFLSPAECDALITAAEGFMSISPVVGIGAGEISASRTSTSCYFAREDLPSVVSKVCALTLKPANHLELPQVGRYLAAQQYTNHFDAFDLSTPDGLRFAANGGQRLCTVLIYLNDVPTGGYTAFPKLGLRVAPRRGMAVVFFPASLTGELDPAALHAAEPAIDTKFVSQVWIRQGAYDGIPTRRIAPF